MAEEMNERERREKLAKLVAEFDTAMLVTRTAQGQLRSRPLAIAEAGEDGTFYFATSIESGKVHEVEGDDHVNVSLQKGRSFVSVSGRARIEQDRALIDRLWKEDWKIWFPEGKDDPSLCLLAVDPTDAEYWDASGIAGMRFLFQAAKAYVTGTRPSGDDDRQNSKVRLP